MPIRTYQVRCFREYKNSIGLPDDYNYFYGNPINVLVPIETAIGGVMIVGAYPSAKFATIAGVTDVPLYDNDSPFSSESYFDGSRVRTIPSRKELEEKYLTPLSISRGQCWITDMVKVFLFKEGHIKRYAKLDPVRFRDLQENRSYYNYYANKSIPWLIEEVKLANPKVVFTLGTEVTSVLFNVSEKKAKSYLDGKLRTLTLENSSIPVICLPHPGIIMKPSARNQWPKKFEEEIIPAARGELIKLGF